MIGTLSRTWNIVAKSLQHFYHKTAKKQLTARSACAIIEASTKEDGEMNKIAVYLNEHLLGEVSSARSLRKKFSTDASVLSINPDIIAFPKVTNDIRKVARFTWQLAEKGHTVGITARGLGGDTTGAAIGKGVIIDTATYLRNVLQVAQKDRLVQVQPGVTTSTLQETLRWQGLRVPGMPSAGSREETVGGIIANASMGVNAGIDASVERLEVVLANGDLIETGKVSRREVSKKLGLQTFEGEIYRKLEGLLEDNESLIQQIASDPTRDTTGYRAIAQIRAKDGSFNLTPLFIGSQGTLGVISEIVLKCDFYSQTSTHAVILADSLQTARDVSDRLYELQPTELTVYDGALFRRAEKQGVKFNLLGSADQVGAVIYVRFGDFNDRHQANKLKKMRKLITKIGMSATDSTERSVDDFTALTGIAETIRLTGADDAIAIPLIDGAFIPANRREEFEIAVGELAAKHHLELPLALNQLTETYDAFPVLKLDSVSDKQKLFRLLTDYAEIVARCSGAFTSDGAEGRLKANAAWSVLTEDETALYEQIRAIFDPFGTLNPGVKQKNDIRTLVAALRDSYDTASLV